MCAEGVGGEEGYVGCVERGGVQEGGEVLGPGVEGVGDFGVLLGGLVRVKEEILGVVDARRSGGGVF